MNLQSSYSRLSVSSSLRVNHIKFPFIQKEILVEESIARGNISHIT